MKPHLTVSLALLGLALAIPAQAAPETSGADVSAAAPQAPAPVASDAPDRPDDELRELREELRALREEVQSLKSAPERAGPADTPPVLTIELGNLHAMRAFGDDVLVPAGKVVSKVEAMGGDVVVDGTVTGSVSSFGGDVLVRDGGRVMGDISSFGGDIQVLPGGILDGQAKSLGGDVDIEMSVEHDAVATSVIGSHSAVMAPGNNTWYGGVQPTGSWLGGLVTSLYQKLVFLLAFGGAGVLLIALVPDRVSTVASTLERRPVVAGLIGVGATLGAMVLSLLFVWTLIGPVVLLAGLGLAWMLGFVALCQLLGDRLPMTNKSQARWLTFLLGSLVMSFLWALPWVGIITVFAASAFGIGATVLSRFGDRVPV